MMNVLEIIRYKVAEGHPQGFPQRGTFHGPLRHFASLAGFFDLHFQNNGSTIVYKRRSP
jgi:hypothetical protein